MERVIDGFHEDEVGDWVAELACGHNQHVRHRPPFQERAWVLEEGGRAERIGRPFDCPLCDRGELPSRLRPTRTSPRWDATSLPAGLARRHRLGPRTWAVLVVDDGSLRFTAAVVPALDVVVGPGSTQAIPPEVDHELVLFEGARFHLEFFVVEAAGSPDRDAIEQAGAPEPSGTEEGGDPACWSGLGCDACGAVGGWHRPGCVAAPGE